MFYCLQLGCGYSSRFHKPKPSRDASQNKRMLQNRSREWFWGPERSWRPSWHLERLKRIKVTLKWKSPVSLKPDLQPGTCNFEITRRLPCRGTISPPPACLDAMSSHWFEGDFSISVKNMINNTAPGWVCQTLTCKVCTKQQMQTAPGWGSTPLCGA